MKSAFILGADSAIGSALRGKLLRHSVTVFGTTRRPYAVDQHNCMLDLAKDVPKLLRTDFEVAYLCAAVTSIAECEANPAQAYETNVRGVVEVARQFLADGRFVVFLSTSAVFDGREEFPDERAKPRPNSVYGKQKMEAESRLADLGGVAIVRFTKVLGRNSVRICEWRERLLNGQYINPLEDLVMSPVSLPYSINLLEMVGANRFEGIWHGSGERDVSYAEFATLLAEVLKVDRELIEPMKSASAGMKLAYAPETAVLGMKMTKERIGFAPQPVGEVISQFVQHLKPGKLETSKEH